MNETPAFPVFLINNRGCVLGAKEMAPFNRTTLLGLCQAGKFKDRYFDAQGRIWSARIVKAPYPVNIWTKILSQLYNPYIDIQLEWKQEGTYALTDLQDELCKCVDKDDDILTQFMAAEKLKGLIREANSFEHLFNRLKKMNII